MLAARNLSAFRIVNGRYEPTAESCDGIHPTSERHRTLGEALAARVEEAMAMRKVEEEQEAKSPVAIG